MRIIEQQTIGKKDLAMCEDGIAANADFAAVIDGSTSKTTMHIKHGVSNGRYSMKLICHYIHTMPATFSAEDFCRSITEHIARIYKSHGISIERLIEHPEERLTASAVIYSEYRREVWIVGDCQCLIDGTLHNNTKPQETVLAARRAKYLNDEITSGRLTVQNIMQDDDPGRQIILDDLVSSCKEQNKSFVVIDGFPMLTSHVKVVSIGTGRHEIVLASDGYPYLYPTLAASEAYLNCLLSKDPLCINLFKATKGKYKDLLSFDDRAYIRLIIDN